MRPQLVSLGQRALLGGAQQGGPFLWERNQATIWRNAVAQDDHGRLPRGKFDHPAQKPALLSELPIRNHLKAGEVVYDPFLGSGTSLAAAERLGHLCYGVELEPRFCDVILTRWERFSGGSATRLDRVEAAA